MIKTVGNLTNLHFKKSPKETYVYGICLLRTKLVTTETTDTFIIRYLNFLVQADGMHRAAFNADTAFSTPVV